MLITVYEMVSILQHLVALGSQVCTGIDPGRDMILEDKNDLRRTGTGSPKSGVNVAHGHRTYDTLHAQTWLVCRQCWRIIYDSSCPLSCILVLSRVDMINCMYVIH